LSAFETCNTTKLMDAAHPGDKAGVQAAIASGDKLTDVDASGWTPLMYAASSYGDSVVSEMLKAGAKVNARSTRGETALMASAVTGNRQTANSTTTVPWSFRPAAVQS
jgi:ankyrin repeat protein